MDNRPLYVDLDGTFIKSDMLLESFIEALKQNPLILFLCFVWILKGKAYLKQKLAFYQREAVDLVPLNPEFGEFLKTQEGKREIILATASNEEIATKFVDAYPIFDRHISSSLGHNLKGPNKLKAIQSETTDFAYAGNSSEDFELFSHAEEAYLVRPTSKAKRLARSRPVTEVFDATSAGSLKVWLKQLRVHQWLKNFLIFVPLFVSWKFSDPHAVGVTIAAFFCFSLLASATYIVNDLVDLSADRQHQRKRFRPLASASIAIHHGIIVSATMLLLAAATSIFISPWFTCVLAVYLAMTLFYSFKVKRFFGMDVIMLASLYSIRIFAGAVALDVQVSFWLLSFSMFIFLSLALVKRCAELKALEMDDKDHVSGRDYNYSDYPVFLSFGASSATLSILMFCFYINSKALTNQYQEPTLLWLVIPVLGYWLLRMWVKTQRGEMDDDPIVFSLKDRGSQVSIGLMGLIAAMAQFQWQF